MTVVLNGSYIYFLFYVLLIPALNQWRLVGPLWYDDLLALSAPAALFLSPYGSPAIASSALQDDRKLSACTGLRYCCCGRYCGEQCWQSSSFFPHRSSSRPLFALPQATQTVASSRQPAFTDTHLLSHVTTTTTTTTLRQLGGIRTRQNVAFFIRPLLAAVRDVHRLHPAYPQEARQNRPSTNLGASPMEPSATAPPLVYHPHYTTPSFPSAHPFKMWKFAVFYRHLYNHQLLDAQLLYKPTTQLQSIVPMLTMVHCPQYIDRCLRGCLSADEQRRIGLPMHDPRVVRRFLLDVAGTVKATELACKWGMACNLGGGTHHAFRDRGGGFTVFNDMAVAAEVARKQGDARRVMVVDVDVHQGDGTAHLMRHNPDVLTVSFHCRENYPFEKEKSDVDVEFRAGTGDKLYLETFTKLLPSLLDQYQPDLVLYLAGADSHYADALGHLCLTDDGLFTRDAFTFIECVVKRMIPVAAVIGGGYGEDREALASRHALLVRAATKVWKEHQIRNTFVPRGTPASEKKNVDKNPQLSPDKLLQQTPRIIL